MYEMTPQCLTITPETLSHCGDVLNITSQRRTVIRVVKRCVFVKCQSSKTLGNFEMEVGGSEDFAYKYSWKRV